MMKLAVLGAGAMGSWIGGKLATQVPDIELLTTNTAHREAIRQQGLLLKEANVEQRIKVTALHPDEFKGPVDIVLLLTKSFQSETALASIAGEFTDRTHVLSLQNGLGNLEVISQFIPANRVMLGNTMLPVDKLAPGVVEAKGQGVACFNALDQSADKRCLNLHQLMQDAGLDARIDKAILERIWGKVAFNAGMNALSALAHGSPGTIGESPGAKELAGEAASEAVTVAAAQGINISLASVHEVIDFACQHHRDHKVSMLQDLLMGRRTEVDALNGEIVRQGELLDVATPVNRVLCTLVKLAELSHQRAT